MVVFVVVVVLLLVSFFLIKLIGAHNLFLEQAKKPKLPIPYTIHLLKMDITREDELLILIPRTRSRLKNIPVVSQWERFWFLLFFKKRVMVALIYFYNH